MILAAIICLFGDNHYFGLGFYIFVVYHRVIHVIASALRDTCTALRLVQCGEQSPTICRRLLRRKKHLFATTVTMRRKK